jgi:thiamine-phosphate pyrophosphorylase
MCYHTAMVKFMREKNRQFRSHPLAKAAGVDLLVYCTDVARVPDPAEVMQKLPRGSIVICRDYAHPEREAYARELRAITHENGQFLLIAGDVALARRVGADGVHLPEYMLGARHVLGGFRLVSAACHNKLAMRRAERLGVDFILISPVFSTRSHAGARTLGPHRYARLSHCTHLAHLALGGVNSYSARKLRGLGLAGVAAIDGLSN